MALSVTNAVAVAMANAYLTAQDAGTAALIIIYSGAAPANADAAATGTILAQLTCSATSAGAPTDTGSAARLTFNAITSDSSADATGTAGYFRILTQSGGTVVSQGTCGTSGTDMILNTVSITAGSTVAISSAIIDFPEGP